MLIPSQKWGEEIAIDFSLVKDNLNQIKKPVAHCNVDIVAVTKYFGISGIQAGYEAGLRKFGESRVLEAIEKLNKLPEDIRKNSEFHFIGHLQTNKVEKAVENFDVIQSVDSLKLAEKISQAAVRLNKRERILLQLNNAGEEQKFGYTKEGLINDFQSLSLLEGIDIQGIMNIAPLKASEMELHKLFKDVRDFRDDLEKRFSVKLPELSMGMSEDYVIAAEEGATIIRIGRKLFS